MPNRDDVLEEPQIEEDELFPAAQSLEDTGFEFDEVESNAQPDLWQLGDLGTFSRERPLELVAFDNAHRRSQKKAHTRNLPRTLPADSLVRVSPLLYIVCPEVIVLQMAPKLDALALAQIIMELCGTYSLGPDPKLREGAKFQIEPVTSIKRIQRYAKLIRTRGGTATLHHALEIALEGSASPGETILSLMMRLPKDVGGYGFAKPSLNASLEVPDDLKPFVGGKIYYLDAFWQDAYADLEYESSDFHLDPLAATRLVAVRDHEQDTDPEAARWRREFIAKADADRRRMREIQFLGIQVVPVTSYDLQSVRRLDQVACTLAACHGEHLPTGFAAWTSDLHEHAYHEARENLLRSLHSNYEAR